MWKHARAESAGALMMGVVACLTGCSDTETFSAEVRAAGVRAPLTLSCEELVDPMRCHLPWPSSQFMVADDTTQTGLRLELDDASFDYDDERSSLARADGFSRVSPILVAMKGEPSGPLTDEAMTLLVAEPGHPDYGKAVPLRVEGVTDRGLFDEVETFVVGFPRRPLVANAAHVAVAFTGAGLEATRGTRVALGLEEPSSQAEADLWGYHGPTREALTAAGVDPGRVARVWDFVTRSQEAALAPVRAMREAAISAVDEAEVVIDQVEVAPKPGAAMIVQGRLTGLPNFIDDDPARKGAWVVGDDGMPVVLGTRDAPFRVLVPEGTEDYRVVMFGHGMGGNFRDGTFDEELGGAGVGKLGIQFYGWGEDTLDTLGGIVEPAAGVDGAVTGLMQAFADGGAIQVALEGKIADALAAETLGGVTNPAEGRRPDMSIRSWAGGSLGGTMGLTFASADPSMRYAVLNVPGAAWTHFIASSLFFAPLSGILEIGLGSEGDVLLAMAMTQTNFDAVDGAVWAAELASAPTVFLIQESIGDPILPNIGSEMVAMATGAQFVGQPIEAFGDLPVQTSLREASGITQYRVDGDDLDVHGFGGRSGPGGEAARTQIRHFLESAFDGEAEIITPDGCPGGLCDFAE